MRAGVFGTGGAAHAYLRHAAAIACPSIVVSLRRCADNRARFEIDRRDVSRLGIAVDDRLLCTLEFPDGEIAFAVDVYAVHDSGFVDVRGYEPFDQDAPHRIRLQRFATIGKAN